MQIFMCSQLIQKTNLRLREISGNLLAPRPPTEPTQVWGQCLLAEGVGVSPSSFLDPPLPVSGYKALSPPLPKCRPNTCGTERRVVESTGSDQGSTTLKLLSFGARSFSAAGPSCASYDFSSVPGLCPPDAPIYDHHSSPEIAKVPEGKIALG